VLSARTRWTGFAVPEPGCVTVGENALKLVGDNMGIFSRSGVNNG
jgi:hypothetical protein